MILQQVNLRNGIYYTGNMASLYWIRTLAIAQFNIKMSYQYRKSHCAYSRKIVLSPQFLYIYILVRQHLYIESAPWTSLDEVMNRGLCSTKPLPEPSWLITNWAIKIKLKRRLDQNTWKFIKLNAFNSLRPRQNGRRFADDTFKRIFFNENLRILIKISLKFVP